MEMEINWFEINLHSLTLGTITISATEMEMIPSPLSMLLLNETGKISHTMAGDKFPEDPEGKEVHRIKDYFN